MPCHRKETRMTISSLYTLMLHHWLTLNWQDYLEVLLVSTCFYQTACWLKQDHTKNLLGYFYGACLFSLIAYATNLSVISQILFIYGPALALLFIIMHQQTLQKNMVALKNIAEPSHIAHDWLPILIKTILKSINDHKSYLIVIENQDAMAPFLKTEFPVNAPFNESFANLLHITEVQHPQKLLWLDNTGICRGINCFFKASWHPNNYEKKNAWIDDALAHTSKNDLLIVRINPDSNSCTIAVNGTIHDQLTTQEADLLIRKHIGYSFSPTTKRIEYGIASKKTHMEQHTT